MDGRIDLCVLSCKFKHLKAFDQSGKLCRFAKSHSVKSKTICHQKWNQKQHSVMMTLYTCLASIQLLWNASRQHLVVHWLLHCSPESHKVSFVIPYFGPVKRYELWSNVKTDLLRCRDSIISCAIVHVGPISKGLLPSFIWCSKKNYAVCKYYFQSPVDPHLSKTSPYQTNSVLRGVLECSAAAVLRISIGLRMTIFGIESQFQTEASCPTRISVSSPLSLITVELDHCQITVEFALYRTLHRLRQGEVRSGKVRKGEVE